MIEFLKRFTNKRRQRLRLQQNIAAQSPFQKEEGFSMQATVEKPWKADFEQWKQSYRNSHEGGVRPVEEELRTAELLANLISFPTVSSEGITPEYKKASTNLLNYVSGYLKEKGEAVGFNFSFAEYEQNGVKSLVISTHPGKQFDYLCLAHYDVAGPYIAPKGEEDQLFGRGTSDMKPGVVVGMEALVDLAGRSAKGEDIPSFALALTGDEEIGGENGAKPLFQKEGYCADVAIVFDGGTPGAMSEGAKGIIVENVVLHGFSVHGAYPSLARGLNPVEDFWPQLDARIKKDFPIPQDETNKEVTISPALTNSGHADNSTPAEMRITFNGRFPTQKSIDAHQEYMVGVLNEIYQPTRSALENTLQLLEASLQNQNLSIKDRKKVEKEMAKTKTKLNSLWYTVEETLRGDVCEIDKDNPDNTRYRKIAGKIREEDMPISFDQGSSDIRFFGNRVKTVILTAAYGSDGKHSDDEYVEVPSLYKDVQTVREFVSQKPQS